MPDNAQAGGGLMVALVQLAIGLGSMVGGLLSDMRGYQSLFVVSAVFLVIAALLAMRMARLNHS